LDAYKSLSTAVRRYMTIDSETGALIECFGTLTITLVGTEIIGGTAETVEQATVDTTRSLSILALAKVVVETETHNSQVDEGVGEKIQFRYSCSLRSAIASCSAQS